MDTKPRELYLLCRSFKVMCNIILIIIIIFKAMLMLVNYANVKHYV